MRRSRFAPIRIRATHRLWFPERRVVREPSLGARDAGILVRRHVEESFLDLRPARLRTPAFGPPSHFSRARIFRDIPAAGPVRKSIGVASMADPRRSKQRPAEVDAGVALQRKGAPETLPAQLVHRPANSSEVEPARKSARERLRELPAPATDKPRVPVAQALSRPPGRPPTSAEPAPERARPRPPTAETKAWRLLIERQSADLDAHRLFHMN